MIYSWIKLHRPLHTCIPLGVQCSGHMHHVRHAMLSTSATFLSEWLECHNKQFLLWIKLFNFTLGNINSLNSSKGDALNQKWFNILAAWAVLGLLHTSGWQLPYKNSMCNSNLGPRYTLQLLHTIVHPGIHYWLSTAQFLFATLEGSCDFIGYIRTIYDTRQWHMNLVHQALTVLLIHKELINHWRNLF